MREIKFRAWTGSEIVENALRVRFEPAHSHDGLDFPDAAMPAYTMCNARVFMQYTGLKDANGVEIYEGDIVNWNGAVCYIAWEESDASFMAVEQYESWAESGQEWSGDCEVIGNIYQNSDLLS